jgi:membrane-bound serine protease (ClpP class)
MVGEHGRALTAVAPDQPGQVTVHGEIWRATSRDPIAAGVRVRVLSLNGLTAVVEAVHATKENPT